MEAAAEHESTSNQRRSLAEPDVVALGRRELSPLGISGGPPRREPCTGDAMAYARAGRDKAAVQHNRGP
jgi:hypothetical protein